MAWERAAWNGVRLLAHRGRAIRILAIGDGVTYRELCRVATASEYLVVGCVSGRTDGPVGHVGAPADLVQLASRLSIHWIVVNPYEDLADELVAALCACAARGTAVKSFTAAYEEIAGMAPIEHMGFGSLLPMPLGPHGSRAACAALRCLDLVGALVGLTITAALVPIIAAAIVIDTGRPVLYRQERLGAGGKPFVIYKFRSMRCDAERQGPMFALVSDPRVTRVGRFLRQTHLDELPQFWNVLRGDMSLVGPRPERPEFSEQLAGAIPVYRLRLAVRPGLTGLTQIRVGYAATLSDHLEVLRHDLYYIRHRSLTLNLSILVRTVGAMLSRNGR